MTSLHVYACTRESDKPVLAANLNRSPDIESGAVPCEPLWKSESAAIAYNRVLDRATADILVFTHSDVYFPRGWFDRLIRELEALTVRDPNWAVCGCIGLVDDVTLAGRLWDTSLNREIGKSLEKPVPILAFDECVLVLRRSSGLRFDPNVPDFHLYGADLVLAAEDRGLTVYGLDLPFVHNSKPALRMPANFPDAYKYVVRKWRARMPRPNLIVNLTTNPLEFLKRRAQLRYRAIFRKDSYNTVRLSDPRQKAMELGYE